MVTILALSSLQKVQRRQTFHIIFTQPGTRPLALYWFLFITIRKGVTLQLSFRKVDMGIPATFESHELAHSPLKRNTLCLGRPLERFRVLAIGRVCGHARGKHSFSKWPLRHKVLLHCYMRKPCRARGQDWEGIRYKQSSLPHSILGSRNSHTHAGTVSNCSSFTKQVTCLHEKTLQNPQWY